MSITLTRPDTTVVCLFPESHQVRATKLGEAQVALDCVCGVHAEPFTNLVDVFGFIQTHIEGARR